MSTPSLRRAVAASWLLALAGCAPLGVGPEGEGPGGDGEGPEGDGDGIAHAQGGAPTWFVPSLPLPDAPDEPDEAPAGVGPLLHLELSDGPAPEEEPVPAVPAQGDPRPLSSARTRELLSRLPPLPAGSAAPSEDRTPAPSEDRTPAPGADRDRADATAPNRPGGGSLGVQAVLPMGTTDLAPWVTVVFSEPMVGLGADGEPIQDEPPARLDPEPPGRWRWLDVRTLRFEPAAGRMPGATRYTVDIPSGVRSAQGSELSSSVEAGFATRGALAVGGWPGRDRIVGRSPAMLLVFDQHVRARDLLAAARLETDGEPHPLRIAADNELEAEDPRLLEAANEAGEGRWVALRPERPFPPGAEVRLVLAEDLASAEGPEPAGREQELSFLVRGPMEVDSSRCDDPAEPCTADQRAWVIFSNPLDPELPVEDLVRIEPEVDGLRVSGSGRVLRLAGDFLPHHSYRLRLDPEIGDRFGQSLARPVELGVHFGAPYGMVRIPGAPFLTLDPREPPRIEIDVRAVREIEVELFRVEPEAWGRYRDLLLARPGEPRGEDLPGTRVASFRMVEEDDAFSRFPVDLDPALDGGSGHVIVRATEVPEDGSSERPDTATVWVQVTSFGLGAVWDHQRITARATRLLDEAPLEGVEVTLPGSRATGRTDENGFVELPLSEVPDSVVVARLGSESAILAHPRGPGAVSWSLDPSHPEAAWSVITDRGLYRPGEEVRIAGWIRERGRTDDATVALPTSVDSIRYRVRWPDRGGELEDVVPLSGTGAFHARLDVPEEASAGLARVTLQAPGGDRAPAWWSTTTYFRIEDFRRPEYRVEVEVEPELRFVDEPLDVRLEARYFDGPPLPRAAVAWSVRPQFANHRPTGWVGWYFSPDMRSTRGRFADTIATFASEADVQGVHVARIHPAWAGHPGPITLDVRAEVQDLDRQAGSAGTRVLVHPAEVYAGLRIESGTLFEGDTLDVEVVAVDPEGVAVPGVRPQVRLERVEWVDAGRSQALETVEARPLSCDETLVEGPDEADVAGLRCRHRTGADGLFRIVAEVEDARGRLARAERVVEVRAARRGGVAGWVRPGSAEPGIELTLDRDDDYAPGDTALLTIASPVRPIRGVVAVIHDGVREVIPVEMEGPEGEVAIELDAGQLGRTLLAVTVANPESGQPLTDLTWLNVSMEGRRLEVSVEPEMEEAAPGADVEVEVEVRDAAGRAVAGGEVTLWAVDEAVLSLAGYDTPDPLAALNGPSYTPTGSLHPAELVRWARRARGPGWLTGRLIGAAFGRALAGHTVRIRGREGEAVTDREGEFALEGVPPGTHELEILLGDELVEERVVHVEDEGSDLGELVVVRPPQPPRVPDGDIRGRGETLRRAVAGAREVTVAATSVDVRLRARQIALPAPLEPDAFSEAGDPVALREDFTPLAAFEARLVTDGDGRAATVIRLPDTATRYRIMAVAVDDASRVGSGEGGLVARRDFLVRASFPRFLHPGDRGELPLLVHNLTDRDREVDVAARAVGLDLEGTGGVRVRVPAGDRTEVRLPARVPARLPTGSGSHATSSGSPGSARVEVVAASAEEADAVAVNVPVRPALAPRTVALHAEPEDGRPLQLPLELPPGTLPGFGELEVGLSTSLLQPLTDELLLLFREPDPWPFATVARLLATASLEGRLELLRSAELPPADELRSRIEGDVEYLVDEVYGRWHLEPGAGQMDPDVPDASLSPLVFLDGALALQRAAEAGYEVPEALIDGLRRRTHERTQELIEHAEGDGRRADAYTAYCIAYTAYVHRALGGGVPGALPGWATRFEPTDLPSESLAWLLVVLSEDPSHADLAEGFRSALLNRALETGATATFRGRATAGQEVAGAAPGEERLLLDSRRRTDAIVLSALLQVEPDHPVLPRLARGLLAHRDGTPRSTSFHEASWLLMALGEYAWIREEEVPDLVARTWLDETLLAEERFEGRSLRTALERVPLDGLATDGNGDAGSHLTVERSGTGPLHVRAALRYALADPFQPPEDRGFVVMRRYEAVDDPADVRRDADGTWRLRAGARVRVRVSFAAPARRHQVRLRDPLPAGVEAINPRMEGAPRFDDPEARPENETAASPPCHWRIEGASPASLWANWTECLVEFRLRMGWPWHTYRELRSDRMEAYTPLLPAGSYETTYLVRATVPGSYVAAAPYVYEMVHEETRGRGEADRVEVVVEGR